MYTMTRTQTAHAWTELTAEQRAAFDRHGFLIVRDVLDRDMIDTLVAAGDELLASDRSRDRQTLNDGRSDGFRDLLAIDQRFLPLLTWPRSFPLVVQLMGPQIQLHTSNLIWRRPDPPGTDTRRRVPGWHRDIYNVVRDLEHDRMPRLEIKVAFFLSDCSQSGCGQTMVAAGSHRWRQPWTPAHEGDDPPGATEPRLAAGDALLFENRTWHAGGAQHVDRIRRTVMLGYSHRWLRPDDYHDPDPALMERGDALQRCLLDNRDLNRDAQGRFLPGGERTELQRWAAEHGCSGPACH